MTRFNVSWIYHFAYVCLPLLAIFGKVSADVIVMLGNVTEEEFPSAPSMFGAHIPEVGITGYLLIANPPIACSPISSPPKKDDDFMFFALIERGSCDFDKKVLEAQRAGFYGAIVYNNEKSGLFPMTGKTYTQEVYIPSVFVAESSGLKLQTFAYNPHGGNESILTLTGDSVSLPWGYYLYPFITVITTCLVFSCFYGIAKFVRDRRKLRRIRLSRDHLKKLPVIKFKKGDDRYDVCAICLDDYEEGNKLRVLPCQHAFHCKCIDPWLTNNRRTCPICKRKVVPPGIPDSDEDSEGSADENTPLLGGSSNRSSPNLDDSQWGAVGGHRTLVAVLDPPVQTQAVSESYDSGIVNNAATDREDGMLELESSSDQRHANEGQRNLLLDLSDEATDQSAPVV